MSPTTGRLAKHLDTQMKKSQIELNRIKYISREIERTELPQTASRISNLVEIVTQVNQLRKKLSESDQLVSNFYEIGDAPSQSKE